MDTEQSLWPAFLEWRRRCALARCSPGATQALRRFARSRFDAFCRRYAPFASPRIPHPLTPEAADCWHLFEVHLTVDETRAGKRYKQWLFENARGTGAAAIDRLTGGAALLMRDVVRAWLAREGPRANTDSLAAPLGGGLAPGALTLEDLLAGDADPADEAAAREIHRMALQEAESFWVELALRERILLAARARGLSLSAPEVERAARCRKSVLYAAFRALLQCLRDRLRIDYAGEDPAAIGLLARELLEELGRRASAWAKSEKCCAALFSYNGDAAPTRRASRNDRRESSAEGCVP